MLFLKTFIAAIIPSIILSLGVSAIISYINPPSLAFLILMASLGVYGFFIFWMFNLSMSDVDRKSRFWKLRFAISHWLNIETKNNEVYDELLNDLIDNIKAGKVKYSLHKDYLMTDDLFLWLGSSTFLYAHVSSRDEHSSNPPMPKLKTRIRMAEFEPELRKKAAMMERL